MTKRKIKPAIYKIECSTNCKCYVGSSVYFPSRWSAHRHLLNRGQHTSPPLQRAWKKYGEESFKFEVLEAVADETTLLGREQFWLDKLKPFGRDGYNCCPTAGTTKGTKRTREQIERAAAPRRGIPLTAEHRRRIGLGGIGRKHAPETRAKQRAARLRNNHQVGRPLTEKQKAALFRAGEDHPWWGRKHGPDARRKISEGKSVPVVQISEDGEVRLWRTAREAALSLGLKSADTIYRSISRGRKAAQSRWRFAEA